MKKNTSIRFSIALIFCVISISACKSKKVITEEVSSIESYSADDIKYKIKAANIYFDYMEASGLATVNTPDINISGNFVMRLEHNKRAWILVKKFGIEAARVLIENDTMHVLNRLQKSYVSRPIKEGMDMLGMDMSQNEVIEFLAGNALIDNSEFISINQDSFTYEYKTAFDNIYATYTFDALNETIEKLAFVDTQNNGVSVEHADYRMIDEVQMIAYNRFLSAKDVTTQKDATIDLEFKEISIDEEITFPFDIPDHYQKIE